MGGRFVVELAEGCYFVGAMLVAVVVVPPLVLGYGMAVAVQAGAEELRKRCRPRR